MVRRDMVGRDVVRRDKLQGTSYKVQVTRDKGQVLSAEKRRRGCLLIHCPRNP